MTSRNVSLARPKFLKNLEAFSKVFLLKKNCIGVGDIYYYERAVIIFLYIMAKVKFLVHKGKGNISCA